MTKLIDLKGASEALPQVKEVRVQIQNQMAEAFRHMDIGYNNCVDEIDLVHLEVDVEAMASLLASEQFGETKIIATTIALNIPKWARLVRKGRKYHIYFWRTINKIHEGGRMPQVIKVELVAKRLRISRATLYRLIKIGKYPQPDRFTWNNRPNWGTYIKKYKEIYVRQFETV